MNLHLVIQTIFLRILCLHFYNADVFLRILNLHLATLICFPQNYEFTFRNSDLFQLNSELNLIILNFFTEFRVYVSQF